MLPNFRKVTALFASIAFAAVLPIGSFAQSYLQSLGIPALSTTMPVESGTIDVGNGNLNLSLPLGAPPQRGSLPLYWMLLYNSRIWKVFSDGVNPPQWQPVSTQQTGWTYHQGVGNTVAWDFASVFCPADGSTYYTLKNERYDNFDTTHTFDLNLSTGSACSANAVSGDAFATDSSGYHLYITNFNPSFANMTVEVFGPDGTLFLNRLGPPNDPNGNQISNNADTLLRNVVVQSTSGTQTYYDVLNSQGSTSRVTVNTTTINVSTNFLQSGVNEYSGTLAVVSSIQLPDGSSYQFGYDTYGELNSMTLPTGGQITYGYTNFQDAYGNINRWVTSHVSGGGTWFYSPQVISTCPSGGQNCQQKVTVTKPSNDSIVFTFTLNGGAWATQAQYFNGPGGLFLTTTQDFDLTNTCSICAGAAAYVRKLRTTNILPSVNGTNLNRKTEYSYDNIQYGNLTAVKEWNFYTGTPNTVPDRETDTAYITASAYINKNIINRPSSVTVKNLSGTQVSQTLYSYDTTALVSAAGTVMHDDTNYGTANSVRGNVTSIQNWVAGSTYLTTTLTYDTTGQLRQSQDSKGNITSYDYTDRFYNDNGNNPPAAASAPGPTNAYVTTITTPLIPAQTLGYYLGSGKQSVVTDPNSNPAYFHFLDSLDRITQTVLGGYRITQTTYTSPTQQDISTTLTAAYCTPPGIPCRQDRITLDGLGRVSRTSLVNDLDGQINVDTSYDTNGRAISETNPYRTTTEPTYGSTSVGFDALDRVTQINLPDNNTVVTAFGAFVPPSATQLCGNGLGYPTWTRDEASKQRQSWADGFGRIIEIDEPDNSGGLNWATCYQYDALNNLTNVSQRGSDSTQARVRSYAYDGLSRLTQSTTPESSATNYFYTTAGGSLCSGAAGLICRRTDARGITTTYAYDALNRLAAKTYSDSTPAVSYFYDQTTYNGLGITNGKGRRTGMSDGSGQTAWKYGILGEILTKRQTISGVTKDITSTYNTDGTLRSVIYPSGRTVNYTYNTAQRLISTVDSSSIYRNFVTNAHYAAFGGLTSATHGDGINDSNSFNNRLQPTNLSTSSRTRPLLNLSYNWGGIANNDSVLSITNSLDNSRSVTYSYDQLHRLASAATVVTTGTNAWGNSYVYDSWGNLLQKNVTQGTGETLSVTVDSHNHINGYTYDAAGNLIWDQMNALLFDAENRMTPDSGGQTIYTYDGDDHRVKTYVGGATKLYWYDDGFNPLSTSDGTGNGTDDYIYANGERIGWVTVSTGDPHYYLLDHLGSPHEIVNGDGSTVDWEADYFPFGSNRVIGNSGNLDVFYMFTGYEFDYELGDYYADFREQSPRLGRFFSPDPYAGSMDLTNPQSLNRYAYVMNNPVNATDPLGLGDCNGEPCTGPFDPPPPSPVNPCAFGGCFPGGGPTDGPGCSLDVVPGAGIIAHFRCNPPGDPPDPGGDQPSPAPKPTPGPPGPKFTRSAYDKCAKAAFGGTSGLIPNTNKSIPTYEQASTFFNGALMVGADPASTGITMAAESNFDLRITTKQNPNGTLDIGPMQVNTNNPNLYRFPGAAGTPIVGTPFNGDPQANTMAGANYLKHFANPARYVGNPTRPQGRLRTALYKASLSSFQQFTQCLLSAVIP